MKINKSILKYLGLTLILVVGVLSLGWHGDEYLSFTVYAGNSLARTAKSLLAQVSSSVSSPIVSSVDLMELEYTPCVKLLLLTYLILF